MIPYATDCVFVKGHPDIQAGLAVFYLKIGDDSFYSLKLFINASKQEIESDEFIVSSNGLNYLKARTLDMFDFGKANSVEEAKMHVQDAGLDYMCRFLEGV